MAKELDLVALGQVLDTSFGRSSTPINTSCSVKFSIVSNELIEAKFGMIVNFRGSQGEMAQTRRRCEEEAKAIVKEVVGSVKKNYKELTGSTLTLREVNADTTIEFLGSTMTRAVSKQMLFRLKVAYEVS